MVWVEFTNIKQDTRYTFQKNKAINFFNSRTWFGLGESLT